MVGVTWVSESVVAGIYAIARYQCVKLVSESGEGICCQAHYLEQTCCKSSTFSMPEKLVLCRVTNSRRKTLPLVMSGSSGISDESDGTSMVTDEQL